MCQISTAVDYWALLQGVAGRWHFSTPMKLLRILSPLGCEVVAQYINTPAAQWVRQHLLPPYAANQFCIGQGEMSAAMTAPGRALTATRVGCSCCRRYDRARRNPDADEQHSRAPGQRKRNGPGRGTRSRRGVQLSRAVFFSDFNPQAVCAISAAGGGGQSFRGTTERSRGRGFFELIKATTPTHGKRAKQSTPRLGNHVGDGFISPA